MNYGLYLAAAGTLTSLHRQDVIANNLANINTVGYKPDEVYLRARLPQRLEVDDVHADPQQMLEQLGGGQFADPTRVNLRQGDLKETKNDLDVAIHGDGFFVVHNGRSGAAADTLRFTRDGRFALNSAGELVTVVGGLRVMDVNDQPIRVDRSAKLLIDGDGNLLQNGAAIAKLQVSTVADKSQITKEGEDLLRFAAEGSRNAKRQAADGVVKQGYVENSAVDPILALNSMINASKSAQANALMMQYHDNIMGQAVNTFARVA